MKKIFYLQFCVFLLVQFSVSAQKQSAPDTASLTLIAKSYGDSVVLRWAPSHAGAWQLLNTIGYNVMRMDKNSPGGKWNQINTQPIIPQSLESMKKTLDKNNTYAAIAAQALYGKTIFPAKKGLAPVVAQEADALQNRYALALQSADYSAPVAQAIALRWADRQVIEGEAYIYKIVPAQPMRSIPLVSPSLIVVNEKAGQHQPEGLVGISGDRKVELQWPRFQPEHYSGYQVELSEDGKNYRALHTVPYFTSLPDTSHLPQDSAVIQLTELLQHQHVFIDSLKRNYHSYYYRLKGINSFGEWSQYSDPVMVTGRDLTPPTALILGTPEPAGKRTMKLSWSKPVKENDLKGYYVYRSRKVDEGFTLLNTQSLPVTATGFTDTEAFEHGPNFYMVSVVDTAGNQNASFPVMGILPDTTAPFEPIGLSGRIDSSGLVHLSWQQNKEEDMKGYKVYFSHEKSQPFTQITLYPTELNQFTDSITLKTLTKKIYYRIVAVDQNNNHSDLSSILELKKPDIVPPTAPSILDAHISAAGAQLQFAGSASTDAVHYLILRKENNGEWKTVSTVKHTEATGFSYRDTAIRHGVVYEYGGRTVDEDGLSSPICTSVRLQLKGTEEMPAIGFSKAAYDASQDAVVLQWNYTVTEPHYFIVYRSLAGNPLERYRTLDKGANEWKDAQVSQIEKGYHYAIQAVYPNNAKLTRVGEGILVRK